MEVIVVAPDQYADIARVMAHEIAKSPMIKVAYWSVKHYEANEFKQGNDRFTLFIGDAHENPFTGVYERLMKVHQTPGGSCYGYDGSLAVVYGSGQGTAPVVVTMKYLQADLAGFKGRLRMAVMGPVMSWLWRTFELRRDLKRLKTLQTSVAAELFLRDKLSEWLQAA